MNKVSYLVFSILILLVMSMVTLTTSVSAEEKSFNLEKIDIEKSTDFVSLDWQDINGAHTYKLLNEDEVIYSGEENSFHHEGLKEGSMNEYNLVAFDETGDQIDKIYIKVFTPIENENIELMVDTVSNEKEIGFKWTPFDNVDFYEIYKGKERIAKLTNEEYLDENLNPNSSHDYIIKAYSNKDEESGNRKVGMYSGSAKTLPNNDKTNELKTESEDEEFNSLSSDLNKTTIRIRAHINPEFVNDPTSSALFGGDNRSHSAVSGSHRVQYDIRHYWDTGNSYSSTDIGQTRKYNDNYVLEATDTGTCTCSHDEYMAGAGEDLSRYTVDVAAQNPLVSDAAPPLSIDIEPLNIYSDGSVSMSGSHSQFPSFGVYRQDDNSSWKWLYNYSHGNKDPSDIYWEEYF